MNKRFRNSIVILQATLIIVLASSRLKADSGTCGGVTTTLPFNDVGSSIFFCSIAEAFFSGLTNGTSPSTYSPTANVTREQMAAFITRTQDSALRRGSRRAALDQFWTPQSGATLSVGLLPRLVKSDGADLWVANQTDGTVSRVRASDGLPLGTWTGATSPFGVLPILGKVFVTGINDPGSLYLIDPTMAPGAVTTLDGDLSSPLGSFSEGIAFDGVNIWIANAGPPGSVSKVTLSLFVTTKTTGFIEPTGILFDGSNIWVTDPGDHRLKQLDGSGNILQSTTVGALPQFPAFDGTNIWVPNEGDNTVTVVRAAGGLSGTVLATLSGNGLNAPKQAAFDGQRILVTNHTGDSVSLWRATDLTPLGSFSAGIGGGPWGACSDGINFWITLANTGQLERF